MKFTPLPDPDNDLNLTPLDGSLSKAAIEAAQDRPDEFNHQHREALKAVIEDIRKRYPTDDGDRLLGIHANQRFRDGTASHRSDSACQEYYVCLHSPREPRKASNQSLQMALDAMKEEPWLRPDQMQLAINTLRGSSPLREAVYLFVEQMLDERLKDS